MIKIAFFHFELVYGEHGNRIMGLAHEHKHDYNVFKQSVEALFKNWTNEEGETLEDLSSWGCSVDELLYEYNKAVAQECPLDFFAFLFTE